MAIDIKEQKSRELLVVVKEFDKVLEHLRGQEHIVDNFRAILRKEFGKYHKKAIALNLALELYKILIASQNRFALAKDFYIRRIAPLDFEFARRIQALEQSQKGDEKEKLKFLEPIKGILNNNPNFVINYIKTHYDELMQKINTLKDKKMADELRRIIIVISNKETEELIRCINDIRSWPYKVASGIDMFIDRAKLYLIGGRSKYDGESFFGFHLYFRDIELAKEMYRTPQIKKLLTYKEELKFFSEARYAVLKSVQTEGKWEGFYDFYNNLDKGKNYITKVREEFGNEEFARLLEIFKEKKHEAPIDWANELGILNEKLVRQAYQLVIEPAGNALIRIFDARIKKLGEESNTALIDLQKLLTEQDSSLTIRKEFVKILAKKRKKLIRHLNSLRNKLDNKSRITDIAKYDFVHEYLEFVETEIDFSKIITTLEKIYDLEITGSNNLLKYTRSKGNEIDLLQSLATHGTYLDSLDDLSVINFNKLTLSNELLERTIKKLRNFITNLNSIIKYNIKLFAFIDENLKDEFIITFDDLKKMRLQFHKKVEEKTLQNNN